MVNWRKLWLYTGLVTLGASTFAGIGAYAHKKLTEEKPLTIERLQLENYEAVKVGKYIVALDEKGNLKTVEIDSKVKPFELNNNKTRVYDENTKLVSEVEKEILTLSGLEVKLTTPTAQVKVPIKKK